MSIYHISLVFKEPATALLRTEAETEDDAVNRVVQMLTEQGITDIQVIDVELVAPDLDTYKNSHLN